MTTTPIGAPIPIRLQSTLFCDHALRQRRDQAGLRRRQRVLAVVPGAPAKP